MTYYEAKLQDVVALNPNILSTQFELTPKTVQEFALSALYPGSPPFNGKQFTEQVLADYRMNGVSIEGKEHHFLPQLLAYG